MAILKFRVYLQEDESVYRDIAIKHTANFKELHSAILIAYEFDNKHQATFYRSNDIWQRGREISVEKYDKEYRAEPLIMEDTALATEIKDPNQKFIYEYDFTKHWLFMVELINVDKEENKKLTYPVCVRTEGIAPSQYGTKGLVDKRLAEMEEKYDLKSDAMQDGFGEEGEEVEASEESTDEADQGSAEMQEDF
ncbi:MAG: IS1096 element passenger TnpR family protein [Ferruginibacter sp.]